jgi:hypothetical protein
LPSSFDFDLLYDDPMKLNSTISFVAAMAATIRTARSISSVPCLTADECNSKRKEMGITGGFYMSGDYQTKGCYYKNDKAFFSPGTEDQMTTTDLPGIQQRIWCDVVDSDEKRFDNINTEAQESNDVLLDGTDGFIPIDKFLPTEGSNVGAIKNGVTSFNFIIAASFVGLTTSLTC